MLKHALTVLCAAYGVTSEAVKGFSVGSRNLDDAAYVYDDFVYLFDTIKTFPGGFDSIRLYTMCQDITGSENPTYELTHAVPAAIKTGVTLMLNLWSSSGQEAFDRELRGLKEAIDTYGEDFANVVHSIAIGSSDLNRNSPTGSGAPGELGENPDVLLGYLRTVKETIKGTCLEGKLVGHNDYWRAYMNETNDVFLQETDFLGIGINPYYEPPEVFPDNGIDKYLENFWGAWNAVNERWAYSGKPAYITVAGWPSEGSTLNKATPSLENAQRVWTELGCEIFGKIDTWWFMSQQSGPRREGNYGVIPDFGRDPTLRYDLTCPEY